MGAVEDAQRRLVTQFKDKPNLRKLVELMAEPCQTLADVGDEVESVFDLHTTTGIHLDILGARLNQPRLGFPDDSYRAILKALTFLYRPGRGTTPRIFEVVHAILDSELESILYQEVYPAAYILTISVQDWNSSLIQVLAMLLPMTKPAGVGMAAVLAPANGFIYDSSIVPTLPGLGYGSALNADLGGGYAGLFDP